MKSVVGTFLIVQRIIRTVRIRKMCIIIRLRVIKE